jgi:hypothetical protein
VKQGVIRKEEGKRKKEKGKRKGEKRKRGGKGKYGGVGGIIKKDEYRDGILGHQFTVPPTGGFYGNPYSYLVLKILTKKSAKQEFFMNSIL